MDPLAKDPHKLIDDAVLEAHLYGFPVYLEIVRGVDGRLTDVYVVHLWNVVEGREYLRIDK
jgi:hypothetical protein